MLSGRLVGLIELAKIGQQCAERHQILQTPGLCGHFMASHQHGIELSPHAWSMLNNMRLAASGSSP